MDSSKPTGGLTLEREPVPLPSESEDVPLAVGLDLGGTTLTGLLVDALGRIRARRRRETPADRSLETVLAVIRDMAVELLAEAAGGLREPAVIPLLRPVAGVGVGVPGPVDPERGVCLFSPNLGWRDVDVASYLQESLGLPVKVDNDVRVATLGEGWIGAARPFLTFIVITVGTGVGSGVVLDGRLWRGPGFSAGEIGHIPVDTRPDAPLCGCGRRGCLETLASGRAIEREARAAADRAAQGGERTSLAGLLLDKGRISARDVAEAARAGDIVARRIFETAAEHLGVGVAAAVNLFNPEAVVIGGGVAGAWDLLQPILERTVRERAFPPNHRSLRAVLPAALGEDAGAVGAASLVLAPQDGV